MSFRVVCSSRFSSGATNHLFSYSPHLRKLLLVKKCNKTNFLCNLNFRYYDGLFSSVKTRSFHFENRNQIFQTLAVSRQYSSRSKMKAKVHVEKFLRDICVEKQSLDYLPELKMNLVRKDSRKLWQAQLSIHWPEELTFKNVAPKKEDAEEAVFLLAYEKLEKMGALSSIQKDGSSASKAKSDVHNIYSVVSHELKSPELIPKYASSSQNGLWKAQLTVNWPESYTAEGFASQKRRAEVLAAEKLIQWLNSKQAINRKHQPILYTRSERQALQNSWEEPYQISIPDSVSEQVEEIVEDYLEVSKTLQSLLSTTTSSEQNVQTSLGEDLNESGEESLGMSDLLVGNDVDDSQIINVITGKPYAEPPKCVLTQRNEDLLHMLQARGKMDNDLPISQMRDEIITKLKDNQVLVISGEPGCGKTTQVPQYIFDHFIMEMNGAECNMVVTQPRRISAISIAERVAFERGEKISTSIGYQVRLEKQLPQNPGAILFCSTGILLQRLKSNATLQGVSHVIVDEVHGRDVQTDFLLILLKRLLKVNEDIRILLMSATLNAEMFSEFFNNCPVLEIPGHVHPVTDYCLPEICEMLRKETVQDVSLESVKVDFDLLVDVVSYIDKNKDKGAILCFLPGWSEISTSLTRLQKRFPDSSKYQIIPVHSHLSSQEQAKIFKPVPNGVRKIVLATNIAETSITVSDVVYVVDTGFHKELTYNQEAGMSVLSTSWITKSSMKQRRGRAGRVRPGECYHLYSQDILNKMTEFPSPEMHRIPLEQLVLDCKACCKDVQVKDFLLEAPEPPSSLAVSNAIVDLQEMGILDREENLTTLGKHVICFATHPRLAKALIYSAFFRCIKPTLGATAVLSATKEPFDGNLENKASIRDMKRKYENGSKSDHMTMAAIVNAWTEGSLYESYSKDGQKPIIHINNMKFIKALTREFAQSLCNTSLVSNTESCLMEDSMENQNSTCLPMISAVFCAAFYPHILRLQAGDIQKGRILKNRVKLKTLDEQPAHLASTSVLYKGTNVSSPSWLTYCSSTWSDERRSVLIREATVIPPISLVLLAGNEIYAHEVCFDRFWHGVGHKYKHSSELATDIILAVDDHPMMKFKCSEREAQLILGYRKCLSDLLQWWMTSPNTASESDTKLKHLAEKTINVFERLLYLCQQQTGDCVLSESDEDDDNVARISESPSKYCS